MSTREEGREGGERERESGGVSTREEGREGGERERERGSEYERGGEGGMYWIHSLPGQDCAQQRLRAGGGRGRGPWWRCCRRRCGLAEERAE